MFESKYSKLLTGLLIVGILVIVGVLIALGIGLSANSSNNKDAVDAVEQFQGNVTKNKNKTKENVTTNSVTPIIGIENLLVDGNGTTTNKQMYKGFPMVGTIEIPSINLKYPVLENATTPSMEVSVGILDGPGLNKVGNTTIAGHNYRNGTFFSNLKKVAVGDKIFITDETGNKVTYIVYNTYTTTPEDSSYMDRDTEGKREITLDTCTDDTQSRFLVLAKEQ